LKTVLSLVLLIILSFVLFPGCEYKPTETNFVELIQTHSNPTIALPETNLEFIVDGTVDINYNIDTDDAIFGELDFLS
jgi:hypothetical protein